MYCAVVKTLLFSLKTIAFPLDVIRKKLQVCNLYLRFIIMMLIFSILVIIIAYLGQVHQVKDHVTDMITQFFTSLLKNWANSVKKLK